MDPLLLPGAVRRTKIVATLGPASSDPETIRRLIEAGTDGFRLNFSHGTHEEHEKAFRMVRAAEKETGRVVAVVQDLQGTKIRVGRLPDGKVELKAGRELRLDAHGGTGSAERLPVDDERLVQHAKVDTQATLGDGDVLLRIVRREEDALVAVVESGGTVRQGAGITASRLPLPGGLTDKDRNDLAFGVGLGVDAVALSFVRSGDEVIAARGALEELGSSAFVYAKVERDEALSDLTAIVEASDGVLVARGDLGIALPPEKVPIAQKEILNTCTHIGKVGMTATQMLESMVHNPRPTRAEASDVANAILDGTQSVLLSGETAIGHDPVAVVKMMARIITETEEALASGRLEAHEHRARMEGSVADAIALACAVTAEELEARCIIAFTRSGLTAMRVAKHRPHVPIIGASPHIDVLRRLALVWGVTPLLVAEAESLEDMTRVANRSAIEKGLIASGDLVVLTGGDIGVSGSTNLMRVVEAQD
ncbi:MAG: pyruvate kinase [Euryarchaeota archaeon]|nr:pyruvate kinase [Euryarchaeota archaeon]